MRAAIGKIADHFIQIGILQRFQLIRLGIGFSQSPGVISLVGRNTGLDGVANGLQSNILDKPVVNQTGLTGRYDFLLRFTPDASQVANFGGLAPGAGNATDPDAPPDIFSAFQQQLGLKLEATDGPTFSLTPLDF